LVDAFEPLAMLKELSLLVPALQEVWRGLKDESAGTLSTGRPG
jgi:hypothetical protein